MAHREQRLRTTALLRERGLEAALFSDPESVAWLTGYVPQHSVGQTPFLGNPGYVWYEAGSFTLLVQDNQIERTAGLTTDPDIRVETYRGFTITGPITLPQNAAEELRAVLGTRSRRRVGVERLRVPWSVHEELARVAARLEPIDDQLIPLRMRKTDEELAKLRRNFALTDVGHAAARGAVEVGMREIDVWTVVQAAVEREAGTRVPLGNDCVLGTRQRNSGGWPGTGALAPNGSLLVDLSTASEGYWSDSCMTYYAGGPDDRQRHLHGIVLDALAFGEELLRPGAVAGEIDTAMRSFMERSGQQPYPHHSGHGVGVSPHEEPRLTPYDRIALEPGMVVMLERDLRSGRHLGAHRARLPDHDVGPRTPDAARYVCLSLGPPRVKGQPGGRPELTTA